MENEIIIKPMQTEDEMTGKGYVHWKAWHEAYPGLVDQSYLDRMTLEKCVDAAARRYTDNTLVAKDGCRVVGFAAYGACRDGDLPEAGEVYAIYVLSEYYGKGVGKRLMDSALKELDLPRVAVWVLKGNGRAIRFYEKCGFCFDGAENTLNLGAPAVELRMILDREKIHTEKSI
ncbi:MAG: GNAT family N-acetyltransferase [Clostridia bacterium]|nr:GNAT family N-acetyltransferase [Clostridia bacterium]